MKLFIASDLHGSDFFCCKMLDCFEKEQADKLIFLGDVLYHGPRNDLPFQYNPKKVIQRLNAYRDKMLCVRGNCDSEVDSMVLSFPVLAEYGAIFADGLTIYITHGHNINKNNSPFLAAGDILLHGHTHVPACEKNGDFWYMNPGSVSIPKESSPHSYMTYENGVFLWKNLENEDIYKEYVYF